MINKRWKLSLLLLSSLLLVMSFQNCGSKMAFTGPSTGSATAASTDPGGTVPPSGSNVCDPFSNGGSTQANSGLVGSLHYLTSSQLTDPNLESDYDSFSEVYNGGLGTYNGNVFLSSVDVPTRNFTEGFSDNSGNALLQSNGSLLVQYFALQLQSVLVLGNLTPGNYQLAVLSDDGSILTVQNGIVGANGVTSNLTINNDGNHSNTLGCNALPVTLSANSQLPLTLDYYQGPPTSIAAMVLYRPAPANNALDPQCGLDEVDNYYFDTTKIPSVPLAPYIALQSRGWAPLPSSNYILPGQTVNPCVQ